MKKHVLITFVLISFANTITAQRYELTLGGEQITLKEVKENSAVSLSPNDTTILRQLDNEGLKNYVKVANADSTQTFAVFQTKSSSSRSAFQKVVSAYNNANEIAVETAAIFEYQNSLNVLTDEFTLKFKDTVSQQTINDYIKHKGLTIIPSVELFKNVYLVRFNNLSARQALESLSNSDPIVEFFEPNFLQITSNRPGSHAEVMNIVEEDNTDQNQFPNDRYLKKQWYLNNVGLPNGLAMADVRGSLAWELSRGSQDVVVAIIDEGVDIHHPDLKDKIKDTYDAVENDTDQQPQARAGHGTACAGIAAATTDNLDGIAGLGWHTKLLAIRIAEVNRKSQWETTPYNIALGIKKAVDLGARVLSCSWGGGLPNSLINASIDYGINNNCVFVFAAGNENSHVSYPARLSLTKNIIAVAATNEWDESKTLKSRDKEKWWGSNYGKEITISAPGVHMVTTDISGQNRGYDLSSDYIFNFNGTSSSTPLVSAAVALMIAVNPKLTITEIIAVLKNNSDDLGPSGFDERFGYGRLNVEKALKAAQRIQK